MGEKILIIDEDAGNRESLKTILGDGYELILTDDTDLGIGILNKNREIALLIININSSEENKLQNIKTTCPNLPICLAINSQSNKKSASTLNSEDRIIKPFKSPEVLAVINKHLQRS